MCDPPVREGLADSRTAVRGGLDTPSRLERTKAAFRLARPVLPDMALALHLIQRLTDGRVLVRNTAQRRIYAETVLRTYHDVRPLLTPQTTPAMSSPSSPIHAPSRP